MTTPYPTSEVEVLIVGAGPTGLALATTLQRAGISHMIVDRLATGVNTSRAAVIHAHTLEVLESLGVNGSLTREGLALSKFVIRDRDDVLLRLRFDALPSPFACLLMLPQDATERILNKALSDVGGAVRRGLTVESLNEEPDGVNVTISSERGPERVRARYVVGADGMHSLVRDTAGIGFPGQPYEESFVLADVEMNWSHGRDEVALFFSPAGLVVVAPLPSGAFRIVATLDEAPERPQIADIQALLDERGPTQGTKQVQRVIWSSRFRLHHRVAEKYRRGRFLLTGDAAHVHSPAGGQGMNTGLVDACVLGHLLADVVSGRKPESHLDQYEALRRPAAAKVLKLAGRLTHMATMKRRGPRLVRNFVLRTINRIPPARHRFAMNLSGLSRRQAAVIPT